MNRMGHVVGVKENFDELLKNEQIVLVFPEGLRGMGKPFSRRYKLTRFNVGHVELSISNKSPIVPVAVIGGEEQAPIIFNWESIGNLFDVNAFPITMTWPWLGPIGLWPLPTKYYIYYGEPFRFWEEDPDALSKAEVIRSMADRVQASVQNMLDKGIEKRPSVFFRQ
jgi:1-acyl-sn-glycerol-3-phosphate acyltransferase